MTYVKKLMGTIYKDAALLVFFVLPFLASAQGVDGRAGGTQILNPNTNADLNAVLTSLFKAISEVGAMLLAIMIIWTGFLFVTAGGNDAKLATAKKSLIWIVVGGAIVIGATGIAELIKQTAGGIG